MRFLLALSLLMAACSGMVEPGLVGTWELMVPNVAGVARWVWDIRAEGTYAFHAEGPGNVPAHSGRFEAQNGRYTLESTTTAWADTGTYRLAAADSLYGSGKLGSAVWHRVTVGGGAGNTGDSAVTPHGAPAVFDPRAIRAFLEKHAMDQSLFGEPFTDPRVAAADVDVEGVRDGEIGRVRTLVDGPDDANEVTFRIYRDRRAAEAAYAALAVYDSPSFRQPRGEMVTSRGYTFYESGKSRCLSRFMLRTSLPATVTCYLLVVHPTEEAVMIVGGLRVRLASGTTQASEDAFDRASNLVLAGLKHWSITHLAMTALSVK